MKYNSIGEQLIAKAQELDPNYKPDKFNDMSEALDVILNKTGSEGGDIWLDISPYVNGETMTISQEGYDLVYNAFSNYTDSPVNKYAGVTTDGIQKLFFDKSILSDIGGKQGLGFIHKINIDGAEGCSFLNIYEDKSVEYDSKGFDSNLILPQTAPTSQLIPSITTSNEQQNLTIGNGLEIKDGALQATGSGGGSGGSSVLRKDGTFVGEYEGVVANIVSLSPAEYNRIKNGEITTIYGDCRLKANVISTYKVDFSSANNGDMFIYEYTNVIVEDNRILIHNYQLTITEQDANLAIMRTTQPRIPTLPSDASTKNYALKAVNGVLTWVE